MSSAAFAAPLSESALNELESKFEDRVSLAFSEGTSEAIAAVLHDTSAEDDYEALLELAQGMYSNNSLQQPGASIRTLIEFQNALFAKSMEMYVKQADGENWKHIKTVRDQEEIGSFQFLVLKYFYRASIGDSYIYLRVDLYLREDRVLVADAVDLVRNLSAQHSGLNSMALLSKYANDEDITAKLYALRKAASRSDYDSASRIFRSMPKELRREKITRVFFLNSLVSRAEWYKDDEAVEYFISDYAEGFESALIPYYEHKMLYDEALDAIDSLQQRVGEDVWISTLRANFEHFAGLEEQSFANFADTLKKYPTFVDLHYQLLDVFIRSKQYEEAMLVVRVLYSSFDTYLDPELMSAMDGNYDDFMKYPAMVEWTSQFIEQLL